MTVRPPGLRPARRGVTLVEVALLLTVFLLFLFGIFEYARYLLVLHTTTNAARDGARHAIVRSNSLEAGTYTTQTTTPFTSTRPGFDVPFISTYVTERMGGVHGMIDNFTIRVFPCDTAALYDDPPVMMAKVQPTATNPIVAWNNAQFTERIAVRVTGKYRPILPNVFVNLLHGNVSVMASEIDIEVTAMMGSEG
jgi:Flp pilus assembly protein TadG